MTAEPLSAAAAASYEEALREYVQSRSEAALYRASVLSRELAERRVGPDDLIALHSESMERVLDSLGPLERVRAFPDANQFLLECMISYGVHYRQFLDLAERTDREKSQAIDYFAHELRTPLTSARGFIDLAARSILGGQLGIVPDYLTEAREALNRLSRLSTMLVDASRGNTPHLEMSEQDVRRLLRQSATWALPTAVENGVTLLYEGKPLNRGAVTDEAPVRVMGNADALLSAIGNLLSNACRYTPAGGKVRVACRTEGEQAVVEVTDTGVGMAPEVAERVFERFYRGPATRSAGQDGLGLGLPLALQLAKAHGGTITLESAPQRGSTFRLVLPLARGSSG
ncbi:MAG TPA: ATP-binding protein [Chloroflexota bacterium]|nr:ATP-binding protein [Chloroflexota bacterium]